MKAAYFKFGDLDLMAGISLFCFHNQLQHNIQIFLNYSALKYFVEAKWTDYTKLCEKFAKSQFFFRGCLFLKQLFYLNQSS